MKINIFKIKNGKEETMRLWGKEIMSDMTEAVASIREENVQSESMRMFVIGQDTYVVGVMVPEKQQDIQPPNMKRPLNKKHVAILKECLGEAVELEPIYSVDV